MGPDDLEAAVLGKEKWVLVAEASDRYGAYGMVAATLLLRQGDTMSAEALWMSCRVAKRGIPGAFLTSIGQFALSMGCRRLLVHYKPTGLNRLAALQLGNYGFVPDPIPSGQGIRYTLALPHGIKEYPRWMRVDLLQ